MIDYCTLWPDWIGQVYIGVCCAAHDAAYRAGENRLLADRELAECVGGLGGIALKFVGFCMGFAVTWAGWLFYRRRGTA